MITNFIIYKRNRKRIRSSATVRPHIERVDGFRLIHEKHLGKLTAECFT